MTRGKAIRSKKADGFKISNLWFWRVLFIAVTFFSVYLLSSQLKTNIDIRDIKDSVFANRMLHANSGITYISPYTFSVSQGSIDANKFNDSLILSDMETDFGKFGALLVLEINNSGVEKSAYFNKIWYDRYAPLSKFSQYKANFLWDYVLVRNESVKPGRLLQKMVDNNE
jgi:hypothetical protein